jgi:ribosomal protein S18 acetylase RimI-like enzyme
MSIEKLGVLPEKRYRGIGRAIMNFAMSEINKRGGHAVSIGIINKNEKLKNWYRNLGFVEYELKEYKHLPFIVCLMRKDI